MNLFLRIWKRLKGYVLFSKKEFFIFMFLLLVVAAVFFYPVVAGKSNNALLIESAYDIGQTEKNTDPVIELFYFDPNTATVEEWKRLGIPLKTIRTIQNYLSKRGHFYNHNDVLKIYGFKKADYERLKPYIRIAAIKKSEKVGLR